MQCVKRYDFIELLIEGQLACIADFKTQVGMFCRWPVNLRVVDHFCGRIDPNHRPTGHPCGDLDRDASVSAANIENPLRNTKVERCEHLFSHNLLQRRNPRIIRRIPLRHECTPFRSLYPETDTRGPLVVANSSTCPVASCESQWKFT